MPYLSIRPLIDHFHDPFYFSICHSLITREGQFGKMKLFGDRQGQGSPFAIALLMMGRDRIMNLRTYTLLLQILLKAVPMMTKHRKDMKHIIHVPILLIGQTDGRMNNMLLIIMGYVTTTLIILIKIP